MQSYNPLDSVIFGMAGVLADVDVSRAYAAWAASTGLEADEVEDRVAHLVESVQRGDIPPEAFIDDVGGTLGGEPPREVLLAGWEAAVGDPLPGMVALVERLSVSLRVVVVANTDPIHIEVLNRRCAALLAPIDTVVASHDIGARLPDETVFETILDMLEVDPDDVAYFDTSPAALLSATSLGMRAFEAGDAETMGSDLDPLIDSIPDSG
jgi:putative hydrolase of the HAD superfamily